LLRWCLAVFVVAYVVICLPHGVFVNTRTADIVAIVICYMPFLHLCQSSCDTL